MSAASGQLNEDQFLCSVCLDVFADPVSTPCGHNFCKACISKHWDSKVPFQCPNCQEVFPTRPELRVNTFISEMAAQFRQSAQHKASSSSSEQPATKPEEVPCDVCTGTKLNALKSCLVCLESYCEMHLEPHLTRPALKRHQLIEPVENLEGRMCTGHDKPLELFCRTSQMCICMLCPLLEHKSHDVVPLKKEYEGKKAGLGKTEAEVQQMIQKRTLKIQEMRRSVELSKEGAHREIEDGVQVFTALKEAVERSQAQLIDSIHQKQRETETRAEGFIQELEQEISDLEKKSAEVKRLSRCEDHLQFLQKVLSLNTAPPTKDWTQISVRPPSYEGTVARAVKKLEEKLGDQMKKPFMAELNRIKQYAVDVTLDPKIVHPLPPQPAGTQRENDCRCVFSRPGFTSGSFYFEAPVNKPWWTLGVSVSTGMNRKIKLSPSNGYWTVCHSKNSWYFASADTSPVSLSLKSWPQKVGVFVDYDQGRVSFYDVDTADLIYYFTGCSFTGGLFPFFSPCENYGSEMHRPSGCSIQ